MKLNTKGMIVALSVHSIVLLSSLPTHAAGLISSGKEIAIKWCSSCHLVTDAQENTSADVPSFGVIGKKYREEINALGAFLADPHPPMPNFSLTRQEIQDLMAYIGSLK